MRQCESINTNFPAVYYFILIWSVFQPGGHFPCTFCGKVYSHKRVLIRHIGLVHEKRFSCNCDICGQSLASTTILDRHKYMKHKDDPRVAEIRAKMEESQRRKSRLVDSGLISSSSAPRLKQPKVKNHVQVESEEKSGNGYNLDILRLAGFELK